MKAKLVYNDRIYLFWGETFQEIRTQIKSAGIPNWVSISWYDNNESITENN